MVYLQFRAGDFVLRDPASYDYHCSLLEGPLAAEHSVTYGINYESPLNRIKSYHVANSQLPQDVMHILLEGTIPLETKLLILNCVSEGFFTIDFLNERIRCFMFSPEENRDKPTPICADGSLHQSGALHGVSYTCTCRPYNKFCIYLASQMWNLSSYFPLIIGDKVPEDNPQWECYLTLLKILQICMARIVSPGLAGYLEALIVSHHERFVECYPGISLIPKHHYMVHFPSLLLK